MLWIPVTHFSNLQPIHAQADEAVAKEEAAKVSAIKNECEADLAEAMPAFNAALKVIFSCS